MTMPTTQTTNSTPGIWICFVCAHLGLGFLSTVLGSDRLSAFIAGSIYLPLWPFKIIGVPVFQRGSWMIPPPNLLGWLLIVIVWAAVYWAVAALISRVINRRSGTA